MIIIIIFDGLFVDVKNITICPKKTRLLRIICKNYIFDLFFLILIMPFIDHLKFFVYLVYICNLILALTAKILNILRKNILDRKCLIFTPYVRYVRYMVGL